ncbi:unnamed protein product [Mytilus edulis]|uniref:SET domain-containing protein n=1 Tax=Mytilus edulis TaxID=6550 RepID=A0A8S3UKQ0_MYTED|nr:unnamed protein product [Mytilus edulis]
MLFCRLPFIKGRGVFTTKPIEKGEFLFEYRGNLTTVDPGFNEIDASNDDKSLGRLVNDDENDSNSIVKRIMVGGLPHLCFYAKRTISEGEEVTFTYFKGEYDQFPWRLKEGNTDEIRPVEGNIEEERPVEDNTEEDRPVEGNLEEDRPVEGNTEEERPVEGNLEEDRPVEGNTEEERPVEGNLKEDRPLEGNTEEERPVEGNLEEDRPVEGNTEEERPVEGNIEEERPGNMDITNRSRESENEAESDPEDLEEEECDTGFKDLTATVNSMETTISKIETETNDSQRKIKELENKVTDVDRKLNEITAVIPKIIEEIISSGTLAFISPNTFEIDESVDEPMNATSTPVSTNLLQKNPECTRKRTVEDGGKKTIKILLRYSWKKSNPAGLEFLESRADVPDFSRAQDFKMNVYKEGIKRGLWLEANNIFMRVCQKIDNLHKLKK